MWTSDEHGLIHRDSIVAAGITSRDIANALRNREIVRIARGVYAIGSVLTDGPDRARARYRLRCLAVGSDDSRPVLSHQSAAAVLGLPTLDSDLSSVHTTSGRCTGGFIRSGRAVHARPLEPDDVVEFAGVRVTSLARTAADVAVARPLLAPALTVFDAALAAGVERERLADLLRAPRHGVKRARYL